MKEISRDTYRFLKELKQNNNREWFEANRSRYGAIREEFIAFLESVYPELCEIDPALKGADVRNSVFRINRDVRFSNDKSPYKTSLAAVLIAGGRRNFSERAGYYIHLEPGESIIGGGAYLPPSPWLNRIRSNIAADGQSFRSIIEHKMFLRHFGALTGERLKGAPRGYPPDHPDLDLLRYKSYVALHEISEKDALSDQFGNLLLDVARAVKPLNDFLNRE